MTGRVKVITILMVLALFSCRNTGERPHAPITGGSDSVNTAGTAGNATGIDEISRNISSPVETANLLQAMKVPFSEGYLASSIDAGKLTTSFDKALNLGILGADLGYLNMYEKTGSYPDLITKIRDIAEALTVGQLFDFKTMERLSTGESSLDSLLFLSIDSYNKVDKYFNENNQAHLASLMIIGVWIEGQYLATQVMKQYPHKMLRDRIGEQKIILNELLRLAEPHCGTGNEFGELCGYLRQINEKYSNIRITFTKSDPVRKEKDGGLSVEQTETSIVEMTEMQLAEIIEISAIIRNKLIANN